MIDRTLIWFHDTDGQRMDLNNRFFGLSTMLNRLMNKTYGGKRIKFLNIEMNSADLYDKIPSMPKGSPYFYGGNLTFYGTFDFSAFNQLDEQQQRVYVWKKAFQALQTSATALKNDQLGKSSQFAYEEGISNNLDDSYYVVENEFAVDGQTVKCGIKIIFGKDHMKAELHLKRTGFPLSVKEIASTDLGVEIFLDAFKAIDFDGEFLTVKGRKDVSFLPMKIAVQELSISNK